MGLVRKSITVTEEQDAWIKGQDYAYGNDSEYLRALIRRDQAARASDLEALKEALRHGLKSGVSKRKVPEIMASVEARLRAQGKL